MLEETRVLSEDTANSRSVRETGNPRKDALVVGHPDNRQLKTVKCFHPSPYSMVYPRPGGMFSVLYSRRRPIGNP